MTRPMGRNQIVRLILRQAEEVKPNPWQKVVRWWASMLHRRGYEQHS